MLLGAGCKELAGMQPSGEMVLLRAGFLILKRQFTSYSYQKEV